VSAATKCFEEAVAAGAGMFVRGEGVVVASADGQINSRMRARLVRNRAAIRAAVIAAHRAIEKARQSSLAGAGEAARLACGRPDEPQELEAVQRQADRLIARAKEKGDRDGA